MCLECGCGKPGPTRIDGQPAEEVTSPIVGESSSHNHWHSHGDGLPFHAHGPGEPHSHPHSPTPVHRELSLHQPILAANDRMAERNRGYFQALGVRVLNIFSSPGSGKTTLLTRTLAALAPTTRAGVIVGDLATDNDAQRLRTTGAPVVQVNTGTLCHLDAEMIARAVGRLDARALDILFIENVGNLVCPAGFDLGENQRVAVLSVTEGEDKPLKYPPLFRIADAVVITKIDLLPHLDFQRDALLANVHAVNPNALVFELSACTGDGMDRWLAWLRTTEPPV